MDRSRKSLEDAYRAAWIEIALPLRRVVLPPVARGLLPALPPELGGAGAVITACNPRSERLSSDKNGARQRELAGEIRARGWTAYSAIGRDEASTWVEPSFAVLDPPLRELMALARRFEQNAVYLWRGRSWRVVWTSPASPPEESNR